MSSTDYDLIIIGAGIAGLRVGIESLQRYPTLRCCILEKYNYVGGRIFTFRKDIPHVGKVQWESGAGRISTSHRRVLHLLKKYGLTFVPLKGTTDWINEASIYTNSLTKNNFTELESIYLDPIRNMSCDILKTHTLKEILDKVIGVEDARNFYLQFPYYSEFHTLRADIALQSFAGEMYSNDGFGVCAEGLSSLTDAMSAEFLAKGGEIFLKSSVTGIESLGNNSTRVRVHTQNSQFTTNACVMALPASALRHIQGIRQLPVLNHLKMMPLLRIYAIFPSKKGVSWFSGLNKIVTNSPIRYIIPINSERGIVMISYTDGKDTDHWLKIKEEKSIIHAVMTEIRQLFPDKVIPDPLFFKLHHWNDGCTYWLPGKYDVYTESEKSLYPMPNIMPNLFLCGESFAVNQCWIESAIDQADKLLTHPTFRAVLKEAVTD